MCLQLSKGLENLTSAGVRLDSLFSYENSRALVGAQEVLYRQRSLQHMGMLNHLMNLVETVVLEPGRHEAGRFHPTAVRQPVDEHLPGRREQSSCLSPQLIVQSWHGKALERLRERCSPLDFATALSAKGDRA